MAARRVAITGLGIISPLGLNLAANWESLREGRSGDRPDSIRELHSLSQFAFRMARKCADLTRQSISKAARKTTSTVLRSFPWLPRAKRLRIRELN